MQAVPYLLGSVVGAAAVIAAGALSDRSGDYTSISLHAVADWVVLNLGHSVWLFAAVLLMFAWQLLRLRHLMGVDAGFTEVARLDQLSDVWIHVFVGVGVIWTAVGMRSALSSTLAVPAAIEEDAGQVLGRMVDGGILLALTTTIVGAMGGYLMRVAKTAWVGAELTRFYRDADRCDAREALARLRAIHAALLEGRAVPCHVSQQ